MKNKKIIPLKKQGRECGECSVCCEGWYYGNAHGHAFWPGRPCYFMDNGCSIYENRPVDPCANFRCAWLDEEILPEWLKPSQSRVLCIWKTVDGQRYLDVSEAGRKLDSEVLSYLVQTCLSKNINLRWQVNSGYYYFGSQEFLDGMANQK